MARIPKKLEGEKTEPNNGSVTREESEEIPITEFPYVTATDGAGTDELNTERFPDMRDDNLVVETNLEMPDREAPSAEYEPHEYSETTSVLSDNWTKVTYEEDGIAPIMHGYREDAALDLEESAYVDTPTPGATAVIDDIPLPDTEAPPSGTTTADNFITPIEHIDDKDEEVSLDYHEEVSPLDNVFVNPSHGLLFARCTKRSPYFSFPDISPREPTCRYTRRLI